MSQSHVPTAPNLDILSETVTDTKAAAPGVTAQMQTIFGELDNAAAQSALIIGSAGQSPPTERRTKPKKKAKPLDAAPSWTPISVALIAGIISVGIEVLSREAIWSEFNLPPVKHWYALVPRDIIQFVARLIGPQIILWSGPIFYPALAIVISFAVAKAAGLWQQGTTAAIGPPIERRLPQGALLKRRVNAIRISTSNQTISRSNSLL